MSRSTPLTDEHDVLRPVLQRASQLLRQLLVLLDALPAPDRARNRVADDPALLNLDQHLWARAHELEVVAVNEEEVR
jgi:hypothetical protein